MHGRAGNHGALRGQIPIRSPGRLLRGWPTRCFDRTGTEHPERGLLHHPARSAPDQMPRVTGAQRCTRTSLGSRMPSPLTFDAPDRAPSRPNLFFSSFGVSRHCMCAAQPCCVCGRCKISKSQGCTPHTTTRMRPLSALLHVRSLPCHPCSQLARQVLPMPSASHLFSTNAVAYRNISKI